MPTSQPNPNDLLVQSESPPPSQQAEAVSHELLLALTALNQTDLVATLASSVATIAGKFGWDETAGLASHLSRLATRVLEDLDAAIRRTFELPVELPEEPAPTGAGRIWTPGGGL